MSLGLANPLGALALLAVAVLVALHLYERRRRVVPSSTLFLWKRLPASDLERERLRADLLFVLQLALLLALIGGYVRPYVERTAAAPAGRRLLLVLDVSASMQARERGGTRFEIARRRARALVAELGTGDEAMLVAAATRARVVLRWTDDRERVEDRLETLEPLDLPTDLAPALELALGEAAAQSRTRITVLTDLPPAASGLDPVALAALDWVQIGSTDDNLAIAGLTVEQPPFRDPRSASATVLVRNHAHGVRETVLEAQVEGELWARRPLRLAARASEHVRLEAPPRPGELVVRLAGDDALPADDRARGWIAPAAPLDLLVVSERAELASALREAATAVGGARVDALSPARWAEVRRTERRVVLFDGVAPTGPSVAPALHLAPTPGSDVCPNVRSLEDAAVVDWDDDHPAIGGLGGLESLATAHASQLGLPDWGSAIVTAAARETVFPLLIAGELTGHRTACLAATLRPPLADSDQLPLLLLALATLRWLGEPADGGAVAVATGVPVPLLAAAPATEIPGLRIVGEPPVLVAERVGRYQVAGRLVLANLFDDQESDIGRSDAGEWAARSTPEGLPQARRGEIGWWLYLAAAALIVVEWLAWRRRVAA